MVYSLIPYHSGQKPSTFAGESQKLRKRMAVSPRSVASNVRSPVSCPDTYSGAPVTLNSSDERSSPIRFNEPP